jgi:beta-1,4-N-acetylglucosaminyltransferase
MLALLDHLDRAFYSPRVYVSAATDALSAAKAAARERRWADEAEGEHHPPQEQPPPQPLFKCVTIPRSREVAQPWISSAFTTLRALASAFCVIAHERPHLLLCNGPGTCVPLALAVVLLRAVGWLPGAETRVAYVESVARVRRLSLSARLLRVARAADLLLVQWPELAAPVRRGGGGGGGGNGGAAEYAGRLF